MFADRRIAIGQVSEALLHAFAPDPTRKFLIEPDRRDAHRRSEIVILIPGGDRSLRPVPWPDFVLIGNRTCIKPDQGVDDLECRRRHERLVHTLAVMHFADARTLVAEQQTAAHTVFREQLGKLGLGLEFRPGGYIGAEQQRNRKCLANEFNVH